MNCRGGPFCPSTGGLGDNSSARSWVWGPPIGMKFPLLSPRASGGPRHDTAWLPAFAGMTRLSRRRMRRAGGALECGNLLPLSLSELARASVDGIRKSFRPASWSREAGKAAASCRTPKPGFRPSVGPHVAPAGRKSKPHVAVFLSLITHRVSTVEFRFVRMKCRVFAP